MEDRLAAAGADVDDDAVVLEPRLPRGVRDEAEHAAGFLVRERLDVPERVDVPLGEDEKVRRGLWPEVANGDESVARVNVVALTDEPTEEAVGIRRQRRALLLPPPRRLARVRRRRPRPVPAMACSRSRTRVPDDRRGPG